MKTRNITILGIASGLALSTGSLLAQSTAVTPPVGYRTETIQPGFNLIAPNLGNAVAASGALESGAAASVTDAEASFTTSLPGAGEYVLKLTSGAGAGMATVVTATSDTELATNDDLSSVIAGGETYEIRPSRTISDLFGAANEAGLTEGNTNDTGADIVWVPDGAGGFTRLYYNGTAGAGFGAIGVGWKGATSGDDDKSAEPVYFTDGIFVQRFGGTPLEVVFTGHVETTDSEVAVESGFNFTSRILPVDIALSDSGLENELAQGNTNDLAADLVWVPDGAGGYNRYYYNGTAGAGFGAIGVGWKGATSGDDDKSAELLTSGFVIERKGSADMIKFVIPPSLDL